MNIYKFYIDFLVALIEGFIFLYWYQVIYDRDKFIVKNWIKAVLFCLTFAGVSFFANRFLLTGFRTLLLLCVLTLLMSLVANKSLLYSLQVVSGNFLILVAVEAVSLVIYMIATKNSISEFLEQKNLLKCIVVTVEKLVHAGIIYLLGRSRLLLHLSISRVENKWKFSYFAMQLMIFGLIFASIININNSDYTFAFEVLSIVLCIAFIVFSFLEIKERTALTVKLGKYRMLEQQLKDTEQMLSAVRREKHDFLNHLNTIKMIATLNDPDGLEQINKYISGVCGIVKAPYRRFGTGDRCVDAMLSFKSKCAEEEGIKFNVDVDVPLETDKYSSFEMVSILSNLIDNALEVLDREDKSKDRFISVSFRSENENYLIEVANNGEPVPAELREKIFEKGFTTKAGKPDSGYGLYIVKQLAERNKGTVLLESDDSLTKFTVKLRRCRRKKEILTAYSV